ncbi:hypothetical protein Tco_0449512 [Tanacetum coccineum]
MMKGLYRWDTRGIVLKELKVHQYGVLYGPRVYSDLSPDEKVRYNARSFGQHTSYFTGVDRTEDRVNNARCAGAVGYGRAQNRNLEYFKDKMLLMQAQENGVVLDEEHLLFLAGGQDNAIDEDVDEQPVQVPSLNVDQCSSADDCKDHDQLIKMSDSNMTPYDQYVKDNAVPVVQNNASMVPNDAYVMIDNDVHESDVLSVSHTPRNTVFNNLLNAELATYKEQVELYERRARFELTERTKIDEQLRIVICDHIVKMKAEALKEQNTRPIKALTVYPPNTPATLNLRKQVKRELHQLGSLKGKGVLNKPRHVPHGGQNDEIDGYGLQEQNELFRAKNAKIKQHYKELYDSIKITHAKHTEQTTALKNENESLKVQIQNTVSCVTTTQVKPKVIAPGKYALDVEPIPPCNRNNREVHLVYLRPLKESVDTHHEKVEEAKVERPLDRSLAFACRYTKHSQELLDVCLPRKTSINEITSMLIPL